MVISVPIPKSIGVAPIAESIVAPTPIGPIDPTEYVDPFELAEIAITDPGSPRLIPSRAAFRIVVDSNEGLPYRFSGLLTDGENPRPIIVETIRMPLYQSFITQVQVKGKWYSKGLADYSVEGFEDRIQIERKSLEDLYGTLGGRRDEFEAEIARLNLCDFAAVLVEASWNDIAHNPPSHSRLSPKSVTRTVQSWSMRYPRVHWFTVSGRQQAESFAFRLLEMFWRHAEHAKSELAKATTAGN